MLLANINPGLADAPARVFCCRCCQTSRRTGGPTETSTRLGQQCLDVCRQGLRDYGRLRIVERTDPRGFPYFWFGLAPTVETPGHQTDLESIAEGYVSVTPLHLDLTFEPSMAALRDQFA